MKNKKDRFGAYKALSLLTQLGLTMAVCIGMSVLLGKFIDSLLGTTPLFLIAFIFLGAAAAIKVLYDIGKGWK